MTTSHIVLMYYKRIIGTYNILNDCNYYNYLFAFCFPLFSTTIAAHFCDWINKRKTENL